MIEMSVNTSKGNKVEIKDSMNIAMETVQAISMLVQESAKQTGSSASDFWKQIESPVKLFVGTAI